MTDSNSGVRKGSVRVADVEGLPVPDLERAMRTDAGRHVTGLVRRFDVQPPTAEDWLELDEAVFDVYVLPEPLTAAADTARLRAGRGVSRAGGDRTGHGALRTGAAAAELGQPVPRQPRVRWQARRRSDAQRKPLAPAHPV